MLRYTTVEPIDSADWSTIARRFRDYNYRQNVAFADALALHRGAQSDYVAVRREGETLGVANVRVKSLPLLGGGMAYISGGPLVRVEDDSDSEIEKRFAHCLRALKTFYADERGMVLRVAPAPGSESWNRTQGEALLNEGFAVAARASRYRTIMVDIDRSRDEIRRGFRQKWRNCLNSAEHNSLDIESGTDSSLFNSFEILYRDLRARKGFSVDLDAGFYSSIHERMDEQDKFQISLAVADGSPVAGHIASFLGDTCVYLLGAADERGLKSRASYLLQWTVICEAHRRGMRFYELGGIDPDGNPGVYHFKRGLGGMDVTAPGPVQFAARGVRTFLTRSAEHLYRHLSPAV